MCKNRAHAEEKQGGKMLSVLAICAALAANKTAGSASGGLPPGILCARAKQILCVFHFCCRSESRAQCLAAITARLVSKQHKTRRSRGRARVNLRSVSLAEESEEILLKSVPQIA